MVGKTSPLEQKLWDSWTNYQDDQSANQLIENYMYLVDFHVERIASHLPRNVTRDDIKSLGLYGLFDALKKFDRNRDLKFDTYASFRIRGTIMDGLRKEDWLPRSTRDKVKKVEEISRQLEQQLQREPSAEEIAKKSGLSSSEVETIIKDSLFANVLSIEEKSKSADNEFKEGIGYSVPDAKTTLPEEQLVNNEIIDELIHGLKHLNEKEQMIISLFYNDELTFTEIGQILGLTTSRISQIHKKAIFKLRKVLSKL